MNHTVLLRTITALILLVLVLAWTRAAAQDTPIGADDYAPSWSPDGTRIAFVSSRDDIADIYVMNADGSDMVRLFTSSASDINPTWSPDGRWIAFISYRAGDAEIFVMTADGATVTNISQLEGQDNFVDWLPDSSGLYFEQVQNAPEVMYVASPDGRERRRLNETMTFVGSRPQVSPDRTQIVFPWHEPWPTLYLIDGRNAIDLLGDTYAEFDNSRYGTIWRWSPDSASIVVHRSDEGTINVLEVASRIVEPITSLPVYIAEMEWLPDGRLLTRHTQTTEVIAPETLIGTFAIDLSGGEVQQLLPEWDYWIAGMLTDNRALILTPEINPTSLEIWDVLTGEKTLLLDGFFNTGGIAIAPDRSAAVISVCLDGDFDLMRVDLATGDVINLTEEDAFSGQPFPTMCGAAG
jgi:Tol biopolymer transport system component